VTCLINCLPFMSIRGPRSALSKFLEEENIKVDKTNKIKENDKRASSDNVITVDAGNNDKRGLTICGRSFKNENNTTRQKRIRYSRPIEIVNLRQELTLRTAVLQKIHENLAVFKLNDEQIVEYSKFLYKNRALTPEIFDCLVNYASKKLVVYDCSMIEKFDICKNFEHLELHYCGQMKNDDISQILRHAVGLKVLKLTGAFLLEKINLRPYINGERKENMNKLIEIDVSHCSRLKDNFIAQVNRYTRIEALNISFCYGITEKSRLKISPRRIVADETRISRKFFKMKDCSLLEELSIANCPVLFFKGKNRIDLCKFTRLRKLNIEGISEMEQIGIDTLEELRAANCFNLSLPLHNDKLRILDISKINYTRDILAKLNRLSRLEYLNISFNENVDDDLIIEYVTTLKNIKTIVVFGCFKLTKELGRLAWLIKNNIKIIGNHAETKYLLEN
ncbi:hypothetical protein THOM_1443, partial [Trachipleistophora hominis]